jgi:hypothetical protein
LQKGYDVKIGYNPNNIYLLINIKPDLYGKPYFKLSNKYYYILDDSSKTSHSLSICEKDFKSTNVVCNLEMNPALTQNDVEYKKFGFFYKGKKYELNLAYSKRHIEYFAYYPQLSYSNYHASEQGGWFDDQLQKTFGSILAPMSEKDKVQFLLSFVQLAFKYQTDDQQFGREKWFFPEEILYYPYSDCDDRTIMFTYLVKKLVGLPVIGLLYPDHICTAVAFSETVNGINITYKDKKYAICDPTYTGADIGMCMPNYINKMPEVFE